MPAGASAACIPSSSNLWANDVVPEEFETSLENFALVLRTYQTPKAMIQDMDHRWVLGTS
jgi:hypothetical protein